jgi:hypothetical protein
MAIDTVHRGAGDRGMLLLREKLRRRCIKGHRGPARRGAAHRFRSGPLQTKSRTTWSGALRPGHGGSR